MKVLQYFVPAIFLLSYISNAQVSVTVNTAPAWGVPVTTERYYYIPDIETYYDIPSREYIYLHDGEWVRSTTLPVIYRNYDFHRGRKVVITDYSGNAPYAFYNIHRVKYVPARPRQVWVKNYYHKPHVKVQARSQARARSRH